MTGGGGGGSKSSQTQQHRQGHKKEHHGEGSKAVEAMRAPGHGPASADVPVGHRGDYHVTKKSADDPHWGAHGELVAQRGEKESLEEAQTRGGRKAAATLAAGDGDAIQAAASAKEATSSRHNSHGAGGGAR